MASARGQWQSGKWTSGVHVDFLTGDAKGAAPASGTFDVLHGGLHPFYGLMDVGYRLIGGRADGRGLLDGGLFCSFTHDEQRYRARLSQLQFADGSTMGTELDIDLRYRFGPQAAIIAGLSALVQPSAPHRMFGYLGYNFSLKR